MQDHDGRSGYRPDYNIAFFTNTYLPFVGGVSNSVNLYAEYLRHAGQHTLIYAPSYADHTADTPGVRRVLAIPNPGTEFAIPLPASFKPMLDFAEQDFDIVHVHHPFLLGEAGMRMARSERLPLVFTYHTQYEHYTHNVPLNEDTAAKAIIKHATEFCEMCDLVIAPTRGIKDMLRERGVTSRIAVLPSGIEMERYQRADAQAIRESLGVAPEKKLILHVGRMSKEKNLDYLFRAMNLAMSQCPDAEFFIAGSGTDEEALRVLLAEAGERVHFLGTVTGDDLIGLYAAVDLFVFASTSETQGMVLVEAMAGATPVIALDSEPLRDILRDHENGRLLPEASSVEDYAQAVVNALADSDQLRCWSGAACDTAQPFDMPRLAAHLLHHYEFLKRLPRHQLKKETMTFGLVKNFLATLWEELTQ